MYGCLAARLGDALGSSVSPSSAILVLVVWGKVKTTLVSVLASGDQ